MRLRYGRRFYFMVGIYKITSPIGKVYVGQSVNIPKRIKKYKSKDCKSQIKLYRSFIKYGFENHIIDVLEYCDVKILNDRERFWQDFYKCVEKGLNCKATKTNSKSGYLSKETKEKMSITSLKMSSETKEKISKASIGKIMSIESREKISKSKKGVSLTEIHKQKIKNSLLGIKRNDDFKKKMSSIKKGLVLKNATHLCKLILDTDSGVFYYSVKDLCNVLNIKRNYFYENRIKRYSKYKYV